MSFYRYSQEFMYFLLSQQKMVLCPGGGGELMIFYEISKYTLCMFVCLIKMVKPFGPHMIPGKYSVFKNLP